MILEPKIESMDKGLLEQFQLERLQALVTRLERQVPSFSDKIQSIGAIESLSDISRLPLLDRKDLTKHYPYDLFAVPLRDVVRLQTIYGMGLEPVVTGLTQNDVNHWTNLSARKLASAGVTPDDIIMISNQYDVSVASLGIHYAAEYLGATVIPCSTFTGQQIKVLKDYHITCMATNIRRVQHLIYEMELRKIDPNELFLKVLILGEQFWNDQERQEIQDKLGVKICAYYGPPELAKVVAFECEHKTGLHIQEDSYIIEIIDPKTNKVLGEGEEGEIVITALSHEAFPLIRFRTGDISSLISETCECGRTFKRMTPVQRRVDNRITINGITIDSSQIETLIQRINPDLNFDIHLEQSEGLDILQIIITVNSSIFSKGAAGLSQLEKIIRFSLSENLHIDSQVKFVEKSV